MSLPEQVIINEVGPRDGWQNYPEVIPAGVKISLIKKMIDIGAREVEITSFVNPKRVPQFADAAEVVAGVLDYAAARHVNLTALALNAKGVERAKDTGMTSVGFVISASEDHNQRNSGKSIRASMDDFKAMAELAQGMTLQLSLACVFGSPFGDEVPVDRVLHLCDEARACGVTKIGLADSAGISTPLHLRTYLREIKKQVPLDHLSIHLHDTRGMGMANAYVALEEGIAVFDAALGGMGGCPFIPGAKGNIATEDLCYMVEQMNIPCSLKSADCAALSLEMGAQIGCTIESRIANICQTGNEVHKE